MLRWLEFWAEAEKEDSLLPHRPDVRAQGFTLPLTHFEVHVPHPAWSPPDAQQRRGSSNCAFVEEACRRRLAGIPAFQRSSSSQRWFPPTAAGIRNLHTGRGVQLVLPLNVWLPPAHRFRGRLGTRSVSFVTFQLQNFQVLAGCAPALEEEVQGRLGRPLSEVPEFCRATWEVAVLWRGDESDYAPSPRDSAGGHLRAAGIRL